MSAMSSAENRASETRSTAYFLSAADAAITDKEKNRRPSKVFTLG
jgi:hypothetical protein